MFRKTRISSAVLAAIGGLSSVLATQVLAQGTQTVEVTGSRLSRVNVDPARHASLQARWGAPAEARA